MKKKLLATLLCLCLVLTLLPMTAFADSAVSVYVGGVNLTSSRPYLPSGGVAQADPGPGKRGDSYALFNSSTSTLTLSNVSITTAYSWSFKDDGSYNKAGIYAAGDLTIKLLGTNTITGVVTNGRQSSYGIFIRNGALTIQDDPAGTTVGSLTATAAGDATQYESVGICAYGVTITGGTVTAVGSAAETNSSGIFAAEIYTNHITVTGGTVIVTATGSATTTSAFYSEPILSNYANYRWRTADTGDYTSSTTNAYVYADNHIHVEIIPPLDKTSPGLTAGAAERTSNTTATVKFTGSEKGQYYYAVTDSSASAPTIDTTGTGTACSIAEQVLSLDSLTAGEKNIYIIVKDAAGNVSDNTFKITIPVYVPTHTHSWAAAWTTSDTNHWHECEGAGACEITENSAKGSYGAHVYDNSTDATCNTCGYTRTIAHVHSWNSTWSKDAANHWHKCSCGDKKDIAAHIYDNDADNTCNTCGYIRTAAPATYSLTVNLNGGNGSTANGAYAANALVSISAGTKSGHTFSGWTTSNGGTFENAGSASTTFTMPAAATAITANWTAEAPDTPKIIEGSTGKWTPGASSELTFKSDANFADFQRVEVGGQGTIPATLDTGNYSVVAGSTVVTLKNSYLNTLPAGTYTLNIVSSTGTASTTFTIEASRSTPSTIVPQTGDSSNMALWILLMLVSGAGILTAVVYAAKKKHTAE